MIPSKGSVGASGDLAPLAHRLVLTAPESHRALAAADLASVAGALPGVDVVSAPDVASAVDLARSMVGS